MSSPYLSFPELPDGYGWRYDGANEYKKDVDMFVENGGEGLRSLCAWVHARYPHPLEARERNDAQHTFCMPVDSIQDGIDLLAARCWLGLTGVPDA